jgi:predicted RNA-binding protein with PUA-like domain
VTAWLLKTEPDDFSFDDLVRNGVEPWDGVTNTTALKHLRSVQPGEACVIYHTGTQRQAVGLATVQRGAYPDPKLDNPKLVVIDVKAGPRLARSVSLEQLKADPRFADSPLVRISRLSVVPLTEEQYQAILALGS